MFIPARARDCRKVLMKYSNSKSEHMSCTWTKKGIDVDFVWADMCSNKYEYKHVGLVSPWNCFHFTSRIMSRNFLWRLRIRPFNHGIICLIWTALWHYFWFHCLRFTAITSSSHWRVCFFADLLLIFKTEAYKHGLASLLLHVFSSARFTNSHKDIGYKPLSIHEKD